MNDDLYERGLAIRKSVIGAEFVDTFIALKRDEIERYSAEVCDPSTRDVTQWELDEYLLDY